MSRSSSVVQAGHILRVWLAVSCVLAGAATAQSERSAAERRSEPIVGGPCEGCELVYEGLPENPAAVARIAPVEEPGEPMAIEGTVTTPEGEPAAGVVVYAYHTDATGIYPREARSDGRAGSRHGRLRGWARTDASGRYRFDTIRPRGYPSTGIPAHVHMHVVEIGCCTYYIDDIVFEDDPRLTLEERGRYPGRGGGGVVSPVRDSTGRWVVQRDIRLGAKIPGHPAEAP